MVNVLEQFTGTLVGIKHLFDCLGEVVFGIAQFDIQIRLALNLDLDEVTESEHLMLIAILNKDVEIGIDDRGLVLAGELEGYRPDTKLFVGFLLKFRVLLRIDEFDTRAPIASHGILFEQVT